MGKKVPLYNNMQQYTSIFIDKYTFGYGRGNVCVFTREIFLWVFMSSEVKWGLLMVLNTLPTFFLLHFTILQGF